MFTVEMQEQETEITTLDETARFEDVSVFIDKDDRCFIRQWCPQLNKYEVIELSWQQLLEINAALNSPVGSFHIKTGN